MKALQALALLAFLSASTWAGNSTTVLWVNGRPTYAQSQTLLFGGTNLRCTSWVPALGITDATFITWFVDVAGPANHKCSISIYDKTGNTRIMTSGSVACDSTGTKTVTGLGPFSLSAGEKYQICTCGHSNGASIIGANVTAQQYQNQLSTPLSFTPANSGDANCVAPTTLGAFSANPHEHRAILIGTTSESP